jgi:two-component system phosphate regulon response regulator PhoB
MPQTILIVDDEEDLLFLTKSILEKRGYNVIHTTHGAQTFALVESNHPDLVILDQLLADADGLEICHKLKSNPQSIKIPILMTSGRMATSPTTLIPPDETLLKPFEIEDLIKKIDTLLKIKQN